jgi:hypothetical protein
MIWLCIDEDPTRIYYRRPEEAEERARKLVAAQGWRVTVWKGQGKSTAPSKPLFEVIRDTMGRVRKRVLLAHQEPPIPSQTKSARRL